MIEYFLKIMKLFLLEIHEWSENFDGKIINRSNIFYFNLKFVCDCGGSQTRTLREVYHFIKYQIKLFCH